MDSSFLSPFLFSAISNNAENFLPRQFSTTFHPIQPTHYSRIYLNHIRKERSCQSELKTKCVCICVEFRKPLSRHGFPASLFYRLIPIIRILLFSLGSISHQPFSPPPPSCFALESLWRNTFPKFVLYLFPSPFLCLQSHPYRIFFRFPLCGLNFGNLVCSQEMEICSPLLPMSQACYTPLSKTWIYYSTFLDG